jgi:hypothetical protein
MHPWSQFITAIYTETVTSSLNMLDGIRAGEEKEKEIVVKNSVYSMKVLFQEHLSAYKTSTTRHVNLDASLSSLNYKIHVFFMIYIFQRAGSLGLAAMRRKENGVNSFPVPW